MNPQSGGDVPNQAFSSLLFPFFLVGRTITNPFYSVLFMWWRIFGKNLPILLHFEVTVMKHKFPYAEIRLIVGVVSVGIGLFAANLALFHWVEQTGLYRLLGDYARYMCAYGGFGAMIFGSMLINDFMFHRRRVIAKEDLSEFLVDLKATREKKAVVRKARK